MKIHPMMREPYWPINIDNVLEKYAPATFVGVFPGRNRYGWAHIPITVFYQPEPHPEFGNRYFGLFTRDEHLNITNADYVEGQEFMGLMTPEGVLWSRFRHDYIDTPHGMIDGGWDYCRSDSVNLVPLHIMNGEIIEREAE